MTTSRDAILQRVRNALSSDREAPEPPHRDLHLKRPSTDAAQRLATFQEQVTRAAATVERIPGWADVPAAVERYAQAYPVEGPWAIAPGLADLGWPAERTTWIGGSRGDEPLGVSYARLGVAETGTLVLFSERRSPVSLNFLPDHHLVALAVQDIVDTQEAVWDCLRQERSAPRAINFITGPSRTADVEQTLQLGAHGPRRVHVLLVTDEEGRRLQE